MTWSIASYSPTPGSNTAINGINIAPGCPASSVGPAIRQMMADFASALAAGQFTVPSGTIVAYPVSTSPSGFVLCNGQAISRSAFPTLFALIGTTYGAGDGSTTFNVPDLAGRVIAGFDAASATGRLTGLTGGVDASVVGHTGGEQAHALAIAELPSHGHAVTDTGHTHTVTDPGHFHGVPLNNSFAGGGAAGAFPTGPGSGMVTDTRTTGISVASHTSGITIANTGGGTAHNVVQPTMILGYFIKT